MSEKDIEAEIEELEISIADVGKDIPYLKAFIKILYYGAFLMFYFGIFLWRPYLLMRKRFSHEMEIYLRRIQGLATKKELSHLAVLESKVKDENSLRDFIFFTKDIATRHEVVELVSTFDLWTGRN